LFFFSDEEEDDIDCEPSARLVENRWFCLNYTVPNLDEVTHCQVKPFSFF
jgi:histone deacetylase 6